MNIQSSLAGVLVFTLCLFPALTSFGIEPDFAPDDPRHCLTRVASALETADSAAFAQAVDVDTILVQVLDFMAAEAARPDGASQLPPILALLFSRAAGDGVDAASVRALLMGAARAFVLDGVGSGAFAGREADPSHTSTGGLFSPLFADASLGRKEICLVGEARLVPANLPNANTVSGDWLVPFSVHDAGNGETYPVLGRIRREGTDFRLVGVENLPELYSLIRSEIEQQGL